MWHPDTAGPAEWVKVDSRVCETLLHHKTSQR